MKPNEALEIITNAIQTGKLTRERDIALALAQKALDKQIPKKPIQSRNSILYALSYICPSCGGGFSGTGIADYCYHCGQALDWNDEEQENIK